MSRSSSRDHIAEDLEDISSEIITDRIKIDKPRNKRKQADLSFIENAWEDAEKYYIKLKNNERIPTLYLDIPCPQCGNRTIGHGQKHRVERKCRVCQLTFQLDTWLMHILQSNTPLKYFIEKSISTLLMASDKPIAARVKSSEGEVQEPVEEISSLLKLAQRQLWLEEAGNVLKKDMDDLAENLQVIVSLYKDLDVKLSKIKRDISSIYNEQNEQSSLQHKLNNEKNSIEKEEINSRNIDAPRSRHSTNA